MFKNLFALCIVLTALAVVAGGPAAGATFATNLGHGLGIGTAQTTTDAQIMAANAANRRPIMHGVKLPNPFEKAKDAAEQKLINGAGCAVKTLGMCQQDLGNGVIKGAKDANNILGGSAGHAISKAIKRAPTNLSGTRSLDACPTRHPHDAIPCLNPKP
jgi:hypothetical protein